jgi:polyisoprenyl-teichoic acid--peptidoglycan teichoic acid transferase
LIRMSDTTMKAAQPSNRISAGKILIVIFFIIAAVVIGIFSYRFVRSLVNTWTLTDLPGLQINPAAATTPTPGPDGAPAVVSGSNNSVPAAPTPEPWDGASRVSLLIMGLDYRDWALGEGPPRTDTMVLLTIDPLTKTAGMLSIPRDLWVNIPGYGYGRINMAYSLGEGDKLPGGGPGLAMETVEGVLGIPIDYYAQIDFDAFVRFIDEIGGIKITIEETIKVDLIGDGRETIKRLKPGTHTLPGDVALAYARQRYTEGGDFDRADRQQQVILAIRNQMLRPEMIPTLLQRAPTLYNELSSGINTNLSLDQAIRLGLLAVQVPLESIKRGIIGAQQINFAQTPDGSQQVLKPLPEQIRILRDEIFTTEGPLGPSADTEDMLGLAQQEAARISVLNGAGLPGLAGTTAEYLANQGLNIPPEFVGDGEPSFYTRVIVHTGKPYTMSYLVELMGITPNNILIRYDPSATSDVELILGNDWASNNPMP